MKIGQDLMNELERNLRLIAGSLRRGVSLDDTGKSTTAGRHSHAVNGQSGEVPTRLRARKIWKLVVRVKEQRERKEEIIL